MIWRYINKDKLNKIVCVNKKANNYRIALSANNVFDKNDYFNTCDTRYISIFINGKPDVKKLIEQLTILQREYHNSSEIKQFKINGKSCWFDDKERSSLINLINAKKNNEFSTVNIWFDEVSIELTIDKALYLINQIEQYSANCYNTTQQHLLEIKNLSTLEDCLNYDITKGYFDKLNIEIDVK